MNKFSLLFTACMLFLSTHIFAQAEAEWDYESETLSDAFFEKPIDVADGSKKVWCTYRLANPDADYTTWIPGPEISPPTTKMTFLESDTLRMSVYGWREISVWTAWMNGGDYVTWEYFLVTIYEINLVTGVLDSSQLPLMLDGFGFYDSECGISISTSPCEAEITFTAPTYAVNDKTNVYMEIKKVGVGPVWSKTVLVENLGYECIASMMEEGNYIASIYSSKILPTAQDSYKLPFTVSCDDVGMRVISSPVYEKGIRVVYHKTAEISVYDMGGQVVYRGENSEDIIPISIPGTYIVVIYDKESGITLSEKGIVN